MDWIIFLYVDWNCADQRRMYRRNFKEKPDES